MRFLYILWKHLFLIVLGSSVLSSTVIAQERTKLMQGLASENQQVMIQSINQIGKINDAFFLPALIALKRRKLLVSEKFGVLIRKGSNALDLSSGKKIPLESVKKYQKVRIDNSIRRAISPVVAQLQLVSKDSKVRLGAAKELARQIRPNVIGYMRLALKKEKDEEVRTALTFALALTELKNPSKKTRLQAIQSLKEYGGEQAKSVLAPLIKVDKNGIYPEKDNEVRVAILVAISSIDSSLIVVNFFGNFLRGISLGSILLLAALGLAITFGLMGVINMAHGEMLMVGAYSTYVVQMVFKNYFPEFFGWYLLFAIPVSFIVSVAVGMLLERGVIRFLYGRPLETLLATWGISLVLIQTVRLMFGSQNVEVANPQWLSGGVEIAKGLVFPYSRIAIIGFVIIIVLLIWYLFHYTNLGLKVRAVTQNRSMASSLGISSSKIDMWTFGIGSGIAGLGGVALSQIGNVGPELGQGYIVDSFMVVVLGGVGKILGTVISALGLGVINKFLEPAIGAVLGKILILVFIILFIQKRPQGIFALKGRAAEG